MRKSLYEKQRLGRELIDSEIQASQRLEVLRQETAILKEYFDKSMAENSTISIVPSQSSLELQIALKNRQEMPVTKTAPPLLKPLTPSLHSSRTFLTSVPSTIVDKSTVIEQPSLSLEETSVSQQSLVHRSGSISTSASSHSPSTVQLSRIMSRMSMRQSIVFRDSLNQSHVEFKTLAKLRSNRLSVHDSAARGMFQSILVELLVTHLSITRGFQISTGFTSRRCLPDVQAEGYADSGDCSESMPWLADAVPHET